MKSGPSGTNGLVTDDADCRDRAVFLMLTFAGFASLWVVTADMRLPLLVIANALRLLADA